MKLTRGLALFVAAVALCAATQVHAVAVTVDCPFNNGGDFIDRGFYIDNYQGTTLGTVTLAHSAVAAGDRTLSLTARLTSYNGTFVGIATVTRTIGTDFSLSVFDFGNVPVPAGSRITFQQQVVSGAGQVYFDTGIGPCANVTETEDTTPPLSSFRRDSIGVVVTGDPVSIASAITLECPFDPLSSGDLLFRGFYVTNYQGVTIDTVTIRHLTDTPGSKTITLVARLNRFDGPLVGVASVTRAIDGNYSNTVFNFGNVPVPAGSTIAFQQQQTVGGGSIYSNTGYGPCDNVTETNDTNPPLDTFRRNSFGVKITGRVASVAPIVVVEYYHTGFGHYFITADPDEIAGLDAGAYGGVFVRTGEEFLARNGPVPGTNDVCRFFTVAFAPKSSHFYTADPPECAFVKLNPNWQYEKIAFYIDVPAGGVCDVGLVPVYRLYNNGMTGAPNHRFTTSLAIYNQFTTTLGWAPEGIRFCAPSPV
jgi:hypothetical protein